MSRSAHVWIMRTLWTLAVVCFVAGIFGGSPELKKAGMPLFLCYLLVAARLRRMPRHPAAA